MEAGICKDTEHLQNHRLRVPRALLDALLTSIQFKGFLPVTVDAGTHTEVRQVQRKKGRKRRRDSGGERPRILG